MTRLLFAAVALLFAASLAAAVSPDDVLVRVSGAPGALVRDLNERFDVWRALREDGGDDVFDVHVRGPRAALLKAVSGVAAARVAVVNEHLARDAAAERARLAHRRPLALDEWFEEYHPTEELVGFYRNLSQVYPRLVTFVPSVGRTWEGRDIAVARVTSAVGANKPQVWLEANIHAREWITSASLQFFFNQVVTTYGVDPRITALLDTTELIFVPIVNPDGHSFTWTNDRLWRKNRRNNGGSYGVDLNRNADDNWGGEGSSGTPSSDTYRGPSPASEPETQALNAYFLAQPNIVAAVDLHSYGQLVLRPYAWTRTAPPDDGVSKIVGDTIRDEIFTVHSKRYTSGLWYTTLYPSSGVIMDWWHQQPMVGGTVRPLAFTIELRPTTAVPGFQLPPDEIIPTGEELAAGLLYLIEYSVASPLPWRA